MKVGQIEGLYSLCIFQKCQERNRDTCSKDNLFQGVCQFSGNSEKRTKWSQLFVDLALTPVVID